MPDSLPPKAKKIWEAVYNSSIADKDSKEVAARKAWGAVKMSYKKDDDKWVEKNGIVEEMDTFICKASIDPSGNMRLRLVASDTTEDSYKEKMSVQLFRSFVSRIESGAKVPDWCREVLDEKSGWDGGMPYCSISHYKSGIDGKNIPADSDAVYVDGSTLKARVKCRETEIGRSLFHSIKEDIDGKSKFVSSTARYVMMRGGRGSGKSTGGAQKALLKIMEGQNGSVLNPSFENFKISTWPEFRQWIPWDMVVHSQRNRQLPQWVPSQPFTLVFLNGARVICKGLKDPDSARGPNQNWLWYDEGGMDADGMAWQIANASVRIGKMTQAWVTTTPKGKSHWTYKFFESQELISEEARAKFAEIDSTRPFIESFRGTIFDNQKNLDPSYFASMLAAYPPGYLREQELNGEYADEGGRIGYSSWFDDGRIVTSLPTDWHITKFVRYWDMAGTEKKVGVKSNDPDEAVGTLIGRVDHPEVDGVIIDQVGGCWAWAKLKEVIKQTAISDGPYVTVIIEQEPGSGGKNQGVEIQDWFKSDPELKDYKVELQRPTDRVVEANVWFASASRGRVYMMKNLVWNKLVLDQLDGFGIIKHDDRITSISGGWRWLYPIAKRFKRVEFLTVGIRS